MPKVTVVNEKKEVEVPAGANLRQALRGAGVEIYQGPDRLLNCRGLGLCGTCKVLIKDGMANVNAKGIKERFKLATMFSTIGHEDEMRLACQVQVNGDVSVEVRPAFNLCGEVFWQKPFPNK